MTDRIVRLLIILSPCLDDRLTLVHGMFVQLLALLAWPNDPAAAPKVLRMQTSVLRMQISFKAGK